jgi:hypothetical protein
MQGRQSTGGRGRACVHVYVLHEADPYPHPTHPPGVGELRFSTVEDPLGYGSKGAIALRLPGKKPRTPGGETPTPVFA